ncbi:MAG: nucleotidyltransferase family protein [Oscillospiraceae bacterium]|nr:nucleotidyltransferase family protein [Oscillospiraceae bacterium]
MTRPDKIGCLLMAAGNASRFQSNKLLAEFRGKPLVLWALERIDPARFSQVTVVTQYPEICTMAEEFGFPWLKNDHPDWGAAYTIRLGTEAMAQCDAILYLVADQPLLDAAAIARILETWQETPDRIVAPAHDGRTGNPCIFPREFFPELCQLQGDVGGKRVIKAHLDRLLTVEVAPDALFDCDTPEALAELRRTAE